MTPEDLSDVFVNYLFGPNKYSEHRSNLAFLIRKAEQTARAEAFEEAAKIADHVAAERALAAFNHMELERSSRGGELITGHKEAQNCASFIAAAIRERAAKT